MGPSTPCRFVAPRSRPWGSPCFGLLFDLATVSTAGSFPPTVFSEPSSEANTLRSFLLSSSRPLRHRFYLLAKAIAFTAWRSLSPLSACSASVLPRHQRWRSRPQGLLPPESPLQYRSVAAADCPMLPWALDRTHSDACRAHGAGWVVHPFRLAAPTPHQTSHRPRAVRKARSLALSGSERVTILANPEGLSRPDPAPHNPKAALHQAARSPGEGGTGSTALARVRPEGRTSAALSRTPKGTLEREQKAPRGPPPPVRFTRRCSVSARRSAPRRA